MRNDTDSDIMFARLADALRSAHSTPPPPVDELVRRNAAASGRARRRLALAGGLVIAGLVVSAALLLDRPDNGAVTIGPSESADSPELTGPPPSDTSIPSTTPADPTTVASSPAVGPTSQALGPVATSATSPASSGVSSNPVGESNGPLITAPHSEAGPDGIVSGTLIEQDGCLYVDNGLGGLGVALFGYGSSWDPTTRSVIDRFGARAGVGEPLHAAGGSFDLEIVATSLGDEIGSTLTQCGGAAGTTLLYIVSYLTSQA
jgi:hypothetical protein